MRKEKNGGTPVFLILIFPLNCVMIYHQFCRGGGIGRRTGLKIPGAKSPWGFDSPLRQFPLTTNKIGELRAESAKEN
jgi:hypothetical protein